MQSGETPRYELIKVDTEVLNARQRLDSQTVRADKARISLAILTGGSLPPQAGLQPRLTDGVDLDFAGLVDINHGEQAGMLAEIAASNPELRKLEVELARARERIAQERGAILHSAQLSWTQSQDPDVRSTQAGISISLPLFDRRSGPIDEAVAEASRRCRSPRPPTSSASAVCSKCSMRSVCCTRRRPNGSRRATSCSSPPSNSTACAAAMPLNSFLPDAEP
ncbi:MAG: TolC family protein [Candidatus Protistobacter heckmanni]|nr:TolC family protein [Candidatus Protistobacter heckmanni]